MGATAPAKGAILQLILIGEHTTSGRSVIPRAEVVGRLEDCDECGILASLQLGHQLEAGGAFALQPVFVPWTEVRFVTTVESEKPAQTAAL
jgi:hypothetical protein